MLTEVKSKYHHYFIDKNGLMQSEYKRFYDNGQLREHSFFQNGTLHGEFKEYYDNGQLCERSFYHHDNRHGEYYQYDKNGNLIRSTFYYNDTNLNVNPDSLTENDKTYILLSGRLPLKIKKNIDKKTKKR